MRLNKTFIREWILPILFLIIIGFFVIGSSPVFKTNPWVDSNAMLTMGKSMLHGLVPYRDVIDQRGPLLYALFAVGASIKGTSFSGVFFLQLVNLSVVYYLARRIAQDLKQNVISPKYAGFMGPLALVGTRAFSMSGAPEEFAFTSVLYLLYVLNHYRQRVGDIPLKTYFWLGLNLSFIFWNKYSLSGSYIVFFLWVAVELLYKKDFKKLFKIIGASLLGFLLTAVIVAIYFGLHNAFKDLINIYFVQNLTSYRQTKQSFLGQFWYLLYLMGMQLKTHFIVFIFIICGWLKAISEKKHVVIEVAMYFGAILFVCLQHWLDDYYTLIWMPFFAVALIRLLRLQKLRTAVFDKKLLAPVKILLVASLIIMPFVNNDNLYHLVVNGEKHSLNGETHQAQEQFSKIMKSDYKKPSLLMINDLDEGFFLATDILPTTPFWQKLNMNYKQLPKMYWSFEKNMRQKAIDFVIINVQAPPTSDRKTVLLQAKESIDPHLHDVLLYNYKVRSVASNSPNTYYVLFEKK
jgi:hypothetical protein